MCIKVIKKACLFVATILVGLLACKKATDVSPQPPGVPLPGSISGQVSPVAAITGISATNTGQSSLAHKAVFDSTSGVFKITSITAGIYRLHFTTIDRSYQPADTVVSVIAGKDNNIGTLVFPFGVISGVALPAAAVKSIRLVNGSGILYNMSFNDVTGTFKGVFSPGSYALSFLCHSDYEAPNEKTLSLAAGQHINLDTATMMLAILEGLPFNYDKRNLIYSAPKLSIYAARSEGRYPDVFFKNLTVRMDNITGAGTYPCKGTATSSITYIWKVNTFLPPATYSTNNPGGSGKVVITSVDTVKREITGTFSATLVTTSSLSTYYPPKIEINSVRFRFSF